MQIISRAALALILTMPPGALAASSATDVEALRKEIQLLRADYEARLQALEQRVKAAEAVAAQTAAAPPAPAPAPEPAPAPAPAPASVAPAGGGVNAFNPALSLILSGSYTRATQNPAKYAISGFPLPPNAEIGPGSRGFSLAESELGIAANIDPWLRGVANISLKPDDSVSVEEAFIHTTAFGNGLSLKAGRFFSNVGYLNPQHSHTWDFADNPLAYQALLGTQYGDDGVQLSWIAPLDQYLELSAEMGRGRSFPGTDTSRNGAGMTALALHTGGDVGDSHNWRAGVSMLNARASDQALLAADAAGATTDDIFNGHTRVWIVDGVWKWSPNGNATRTNFKLQGEYLRGTRDGTLRRDVDNANILSNYRVTQTGWYVQGIYQFMPGWRIGLRTERLDPGSTALFGNYHPYKNSLMVDYNPSEFSRIRLQFAQDRARRDAVDNQLILQYQVSLGAHGAHSY